MCGVAGILNFDGTPVALPVLIDMGAALHHRGPDDEGQFIDGGVGLASKRLAIIDIASGHQPISSVRGTLTIAFNGEIFNYVELREELVRLGHTFKTLSDTEVILEMYEEYGAACVARLNGQFAFLLY